MLAAQERIARVIRAGDAIITGERDADARALRTLISLCACISVIAWVRMRRIEAPTCRITAIVSAGVSVITGEVVSNAEPFDALVIIRTAALIITGAPGCQRLRLTRAGLGLAGLNHTRCILSSGANHHRSRIDLAGVVTSAIERAIAEVSILEGCAVRINAALADKRAALTHAALAEVIGGAVILVRARRAISGHGVDTANLRLTAIRGAGISVSAGNQAPLA